MGKTQFTEDMLNKLLAAFNEHDLDAVMSFFADDAVMISPSGNHRGMPIKGKAAIRTAFERRFSEQPDVQWNEAVNFLAGNRAYTSWRVQSETAGVDTIGCDVWTFSNGKVIVKDVFYKGP